MPTPDSVAGDAVAFGKGYVGKICIRHLSTSSLQDAPHYKKKNMK
jgi:hypothetical protein